MKNKYFYPGLFFALIILLGYLYDYQQMTFIRPQGHHQWRQCDGAAQARNYYYESMNFFEPRLNILLGNDGKTVAEFPLVYYIGACLYKVFGFHEYILRMISLSIFFTGLWALFKTALLILKDRFYALLISLLPFTSPIVIYYANNFLPDVPAFSYTLIGYYYFIKYLQSNKAKYLFPSALLFALAGMTKVTSLIGFSAIGGLFIFLNLFNIAPGSKNKWWKSFSHIIPFLLTPLLLSLTWIVYAHYYKEINDNPYFLANIRPIWRMTSEQIEATLYRFDYQWYKAFFYREFVNVFFLLVAIAYLIPNRKNKPLLIWFALILSASWLYLIFFFDQLFEHDYYLVCLIIVPVTLCLLLIYRIKEWKPQFFDSLYMKVGVLIFFTVCLYHGQRITKKMLRTDDDKTRFAAMMYIEPYLDSMGVNRNDRVISLGDETSEVSLYLMNRRGWTDLDIPITPKDMAPLIKKGAKFLIVQPKWEPSEDKLRPYLPFIKNKIGTYQGALIYSLKKL